MEDMENKSFQVFMDCVINFLRFQISLPQLILAGNQVKMIKSWESFESLESLMLFIRSGQEYADLNNDFGSLEKYFYYLAPNEQTSFLEILIPKILKLAKEKDVSQLTISGKLNRGNRVEFTRKEISHILANAFFCRFQGSSSSINFNRLFSGSGNSSTKVEKLKCIIQYFEQVTAEYFENTEWSQEKVTFKIVETINALPWEKSNEPLNMFTKNLKDSMFDCPPNMAQVDFANKSIGGGVLGNGCVQEEIKFITCPELIVAKAFCEDLKENEALLMDGVKPFSKFNGYASSFRFGGNADPFADCSKNVIAIDALDFSRKYPEEQYRKENIDRELLKAYTGFSNCALDQIATGNWGGGAFRGNPKLKMQIQWIAATAAKKKLCYYCYNNEKLSDIFENVTKEFQGLTISKAYEKVLNNQKRDKCKQGRIIKWIKILCAGLLTVLAFSSIGWMWLVLLFNPEQNFGNYTRGEETNFPDNSTRNNVTDVATENFGNDTTSEAFDTYNNSTTDVPTQIIS